MAKNDLGSSNHMSAKIFGTMCLNASLKSHLGMAQFSAAKPVKNTSSKWKNGKCIDSLNKHLAAGRVVT